MAVFGKNGAGVTIDRGFGLSLLFMLLVSSLLNGFVFYYHFKKPRKLISKMFCLLAFSGLFVKIDLMLLKLFIIINHVMNNADYNKNLFEKRNWVPK